MTNDIEWHIGCSGFHYKEWKGVFYPEKLPQKKWFDYYSQQFNTLELNVTFYRFPQLSFLQNWYEKSPQGFSFSVKVPRIITHYKKFADCDQLLADFYGVIREGLGSKLGAVLFQLPPQIAYTPQRLQQIIESMDTAFTNVVEFRHISWWQQEVYEQLSKKNIVFCSISHPLLPDNVVINTNTVYYRFHGVPRLYYSGYSDEKLQEIIHAIKKSNLIKNAYLYFNNTADVVAIDNARQAIALSATRGK
jgi:uncharacterized protein YecE (DUF72 family)